MAVVGAALHVAVQGLRCQVMGTLRTGEMGSRLRAVARPLGREVADAPLGQVMLVAVAVGLLAYALFCLLEARYRRVGSSVSGLA